MCDRFCQQHHQNYLEACCLSKKLVYTKCYWALNDGDKTQISCIFSKVEDLKMKSGYELSYMNNFFLKILTSSVIPWTFKCSAQCLQSKSWLLHPAVPTNCAFSLFRKSFLFSYLVPLRQPTTEYAHLCWTPRWHVKTPASVNLELLSSMKDCHKDSNFIFCHSPDVPRLGTEVF